jgi:hypothetical protein
LGLKHDPEKWWPVSRLREAQAPVCRFVRCFGGRRQVGKDHAQAKSLAMRVRLVLLTMLSTIAAGLMSVLLPGSAQQSSAPQGSLAQSWPALPTGGFIAGRPATDKDVADGNAVFVLRAYGVAFGKPLDVTIPQYAYLTKRGQQPVAVIVVQAEQGKGIKIFGVRDRSGKAATARESEVQLLGTNPPN